MANALRIGIAGLGTVGASLVRILADRRDMLAIACGRPLDVMRAHLSRYGWTMADYHLALLRAIWKREIKVDLTRPVCVDAPLHPEKKTVLEMFRHWFMPGA